MTEQQLKQIPIAPRDPIAHPLLPKRNPIARRPVYRPEEQTEDVGAEQRTST